MLSASLTSLEEDAGAARSPTEAAADAELESWIYIVIHRSPDEIVHVSAESVDEENRLKEDDRAPEEPTLPLPPTSHPHHCPSRPL